MNETTRQNRTIAEQLVALARDGRYERLRSTAGRRLAERIAGHEIAVGAAEREAVVLRAPMVAWPPSGGGR